MKAARTFFIAMLILSVFLISACKSNDPAEVYPEMIRIYTEAPGRELAYDCNVKISDGSRTSEYIFNGDLLIKKDGETVSMAERGDIRIDLDMGNTTSVAVRSYYHNGKLYSEINDTRYCKAMSPEEAMALMGPISTPVTNLEVSDFKELTLKDNEADGTRTISVMISADAIKKIVGLEESWRRIASIGETKGKVEFKDVRGYFVLKDNVPIKQSLTIIGTIKTGEKTLSITEELVLGITMNEAVVVSEPVVDKYTVIN
ncbi:MAG: hypothetical protein J5865_09225 [Lachnospiraceae bacterium]|nr:hypothetical protein [Lachnospiraceae bacterium]